MAKLPVQKVSSNTNDGFSETIKFHVMHQANVQSNNNKFYCCEAQKHSNGRYRIFTHYGRLGISNIYEIRDNINGQPILDETLILNELESLHKKKLRGKSAIDPDTGNKIRECYVDVDTVAPTVGSENIRDKKIVTKTVTSKAAIDTSVYTDPNVSKIISQLIDENIHNITNSTSISFTADGYATSLGPVTAAHVDKARKPLDELNKLMTKDGLDPGRKSVQQLNSTFFSLIPKPFSRKITEADMILTADQLQAEYDILDQLATGVQMGATMSGNTSQRLQALGTEIEVLKNPDEIRRIKKGIRESKASNHRYEDVWNYDIYMIYKIKIPSDRYRFDLKGRKAGNIKELYHGSAVANGLSILKSGLHIPPISSGHVTGRLFSNGAYFADASTKSLRYSLGYWGTRKSKYGNAILFIADVALGKTYVTKNTYYPYNGAKPGYDSTSALKSRGNLYNNEYIVYDLGLQTLTYLVEMRS